MMPYREPSIPQPPVTPRPPITVWDIRALTDAEESVGFGLWMGYIVAGALPLCLVPRGTAPGWIPWYLLFHFVACFLFPTLYWLAVGARRIKV